METQQIADPLGPVCRLSGAERSSRVAAVQRFVALAADVAEIPQGVRLSFPRTAVAARSIIDFIRTERECCGEVSYQVRHAVDSAPIDLDIVGSDGDAARLQAFYLGLAKPR